MKAANINIIDNYFSILNNLDADTKLEIISRLSNSLLSGKRAPEKSLKELFGAFKSDKTDEEIVEEIKKSRNFNRKPVSFD